MTNIFRRMSDNTQPIILFIWPLSCFVVALAIVLMVEDYLTSKAGYEMLPTNKVNTGAVIFAVAFLPQACQILLFYMFGRNTKRGWAIILAGVFFLADLSTDAWFKSGGQWSMMPLAIVESLFVFTLGSEILFTVTAGFVFETLGDFIIVFSALIRSIMDAFRNALAILGLGSEEDNRKIQ